MGAALIACCGLAAREALQTGKVMARHQYRVGDLDRAVSPRLSVGNIESTIAPRLKRAAGVLRIWGHVIRAAAVVGIFAGGLAVAEAATAPDAPSLQSVACEVRGKLQAAGIPIRNDMCER
jgi:hypothetical protein